MRNGKFTLNPEKDSVAFWDHVENARLYQEEMDKFAAIEKARDIFIAHAVHVLGNLPANEDEVSVLETYDRYRKVKNAST